MLNWFRPKPKDPGIDFSQPGVDLHSHLIPGLDDGAQNLQESVALIRRLMELGFHKIIATPHIMADYYRNTPDTINSGLDKLRAELQKQEIEIAIEAAAEYYLDEAFENKLESGNVLTLGDNFLLFELSFVNYPQNLFEVIENIKDKGYKPLLAHPERYPYLYGSIENYYKIKELDCYFQLNTISLTGYYGKQAQKAAESLVDNVMIEFIGSDMHHLKHADALKHSLNFPYVQKLLTDYQLQNELL